MRRYTTTLMTMAMGAMLATGCPPEPPGGSGDDDTSDDVTEPGTDEDGDGWSVEAGDCDDADGAIHPGADEDPYDGIDQDCDGDDLTDVDGDGFDGGDLGSDCDDGDPEVNPGADEQACNGVDDDCDGLEPEELRVPSFFPTITDAIDFASEGDIVCVDPGVYQENLNFLGKDIQVIGIDGPDVTHLDGQDLDATVTFQAGEGPDALLTGFSVYGGLSGTGGGIIIAQSSPTLRDLIVMNNQATDCGGLVLYESSSRILDVEIRANSAAGIGGGICLVYGLPTLERVVVADNSAGDAAGGIYALLTEAGIDGGRIEGNVAGDDGGGIHVDESVLRLTRSRIEANQTSGWGGGVYVGVYSQLEGAQLLVADNDGGSYGGGVYANIDSQLALDHVLLLDNRASERGGGLRLNMTAGTVSHAIVAGNAADHGAGIAIYDAAVPMDHVSVVGNRAATKAGGILFIDGEESPLGHAIVADNSGFESGAGVAVDGNAPAITYTAFHGNQPDDVAGLTDPIGTDGNVAADPMFLSTSGTSARSWDLHLAATSPLVDAGDPLATDPDGSIADPGAFGGEAAARFDVDGDGHPLWWQPGDYDAGLAAAGFDCDDLDAAVFPGSGC